MAIVKYFSKSDLYYVTNDSFCILERIDTVRIHLYKEKDDNLSGYNRTNLALFELIFMLSF